MYPILDQARRIPHISASGLRNYFSKLLAIFLHDFFFNFCTMHRNNGCFLEKMQKNKYKT